MLAAFRGEEELTMEEIHKVAYYNGIPFSVLTCPKLVMLDMGRTRHKKMVEDVKDLHTRLERMAGEGNGKAEKYLGYEGSRRIQR